MASTTPWEEIRDPVTAPESPPEDASVEELRAALRACAHRLRLRDEQQAKDYDLRLELYRRLRAQDPPVLVREIAKDAGNAENTVRVALSRPPNWQRRAKGASGAG